VATTTDRASGGGSDRSHRLAQVHLSWVPPTTEVAACIGDTRFDAQIDGRVPSGQLQARLPQGLRKDLAQVCAGCRVSTCQWRVQSA